MPTVVKKTTVVTTKTVHVSGNKTVETVQTMTSSSDGDEKDAKQIEEAMAESQKAMDDLFEGFGERMSKVFKPFDRLFGKK
jgi:hypothetical protein